MIQISQYYKFRKFKNVRWVSHDSPSYDPSTFHALRFEMFVTFQHNFLRVIFDVLVLSKIYSTFSWECLKHTGNQQVIWRLHGVGTRKTLLQTEDTIHDTSDKSYYGVATLSRID